MHQLSVEHCCCLLNKGKTYRFFSFFFPCLLLLSGEETRSKRARMLSDISPCLPTPRCCTSGAAENQEREQSNGPALPRCQCLPPEVHHIGSKRTQPPENLSLHCHREQLSQRSKRIAEFLLTSTFCCDRKHPLPTAPSSLSHTE